eukprot:TRINITY_DN76222_c0_g1_i1.p1 TRINITY_DN76222_c0_g1~~TRINITY_DN76222_c0_g1_i1.p1  ORF type:complete len:242 (+),score=49.54 TRINITY_DN76222_c0_g1_i1:64-789(+)
MGKGKVKGFSGKGASSSVIKPWLKQGASVPKKGSGKVGGGGKGGPIAPWSSKLTQKVAPKVGFKVGGKIYSGEEDGWSRKNGNSTTKSTTKSSVKSTGKSTGKSSGKGKGAGSGKGKGKGKKRAAPLESKFWKKKVENENRVLVGEKSYSGRISRYIYKQGWGFLLPDNPSGMPKQVKLACEEAAIAAEEAGKEVDPNAIYFRKPDVNHEDGFKLREDVRVTFSVYVDDKGAGACNVTMEA